jgi:site-specific recombinase XerC
MITLGKRLRTEEPFLTSANRLKTLKDTWQVYLTIWLDALETGQAMRNGKRALPQTVRTYRIATEQLGGFLRQAGLPTDPTLIRREHLLEWLRWMRAPKAEGGQGLSEQTCLQRYRSVSRFFAWLEEEGEIKETPMAKMKPPRPPEKQVPVISDDDLKRLFRMVSGSDFESRRDRAILALFIDTGMRLAEMAGITLDDIDIDEREITVMGKGARPRTLRFVKETRADITRYILARAKHPHNEDDWLWLGKRGQLTVSGIYRMVQRRCEEAGIPDIHPHQFRHTFAHQYLRAGGNEGDLMRGTGWKSRQMVDRYGASAASERAREAHDQFSPRRGL